MRSPRSRRVITFDNRGVAASSGRTPCTVAQMALDAIDFIDALGVGEVDLLGFSLGSSVAQEIALVRPSIVRNVVLASSAPQGRAACTAGRPRSSTPSASPRRRRPGTSASSSPAPRPSRAAGQQVAGRVFGARTVDRDAPTTWQTRLAQYDAVCAWGQPNHALLERVSAIDKPVFVANGDSDPMILPHYSYLLAGLIPGARLKIYPDAAHGFLFQHHAEFAADVDAFLTAHERGQVALLGAARDAAGGLDGWRTHAFLSAHLSKGQATWALKGRGQGEPL